MKNKLLSYTRPASSKTKIDSVSRFREIVKKISLQSTLYNSSVLPVSAGIGQELTVSGQPLFEQVIA